MDAAAIAAVHAASWRAAYRRLLPDEFLDRLDAGRWLPVWERMLAESDWPRRGTVIASAADGALVGFASVCPTRDDDAGSVPTGEVAAIYVHPECWGSGVGRALMAVATERLRNAGFRSATLWVLRDNERARRFYERAGWSLDGRSKDDVVAGVTVTEVRYRRDL